MAAPPTTVRVTPGGIKLKDGYTTKIAFALDPDISLWEKDVQPGSPDGGPPIDQTTMWNTLYRTKAPQSLVDTTDGKSKCAYDPAALTQIMAIINREGGITVRYADGSTEDVWGYVQKFERDPLVIGQQPEATVTWVTTNFDPNAKVEQGPVVTSVAGT